MVPRKGQASFMATSMPLRKRIFLPGTTRKSRMWSHHATLSTVARMPSTSFA